MAALVLLVKHNTHKTNPFFATLDSFKQNKQLLVESNLVESLLCNHHVPVDLHKKNIKDLIEYYNKSLDFSLSNYQELKEQFARQEEEIRKNSPLAVEASHVIPDTVSQNARNMMTDPLRIEDLTEADLYCTGFKPDLLTIVPNALPLRDEEVNQVKLALFLDAIHNRWSVLGTSRDTKQRSRDSLVRFDQESCNNKASLERE